MKPFNLRLLLTIYLSLAVCALPAAKELDFPAPKDAQVSIVGKNMVVGGKTMDIRQFYTRDKMEKVKKFYYRLWEKGEIKDLPGYLETTDNPPWHIISRLQQGYLLTVQIQPTDNGGSWGYLASSELAQKSIESSIAESMPKLPGSEIVHDMQTEDIGQSGNTMIISNKQSLKSNTDYYKNYYQQRGWRTDLDQEIPDEYSHVLAFTNGRDKVNLVMRRVNKSTFITVNRVVHDVL